MGNNDQDKAKPRRASLPKELKTDDLTLDEALVLLSLPRLLGVHPEGGVVEADRGRFGLISNGLKMKMNLKTDP